MPPPIKTYYGASPEEQEDLLELRKTHYTTLRELEKQAARYGGAVPAHIATGIAEAEANIRAIDEAMRSPIEAATAEKLGATGQFSVLALRIDLLMEQQRTAQTESERWRLHLVEQIQNLNSEIAEETKRWHGNLVEQVKGIHSVIEAETDKWREVQRGNWILFLAIGVLLLFVVAAIIGLAIVISLRW